MSAAGIASPSHGTSTGSGAETCPRCHTTTPWGQSSWCPECSYYPVVDRGSKDGRSWADNLPPAPQGQEEDNRSALQSIPAWFWIMLAGVVGITGASVAVRLLHSHADDEVMRGRIALAQLTVGLISALTAHLIAAKKAMAEDRRINLTDVFLSWFNVWQPTITELPKACGRVWAMVWGCVAFLTAVTIIGGIDYGAPFRVHTAPDIKPMKLIGAVANAAKEQGKKKGDPESLGEALADLAGEVSDLEGEGGSDKSMEEALGELGKIDDSLKNMNLNPDELRAMTRRTLTCQIYGVVIDAKKTPVSFLFFANTTGQDTHVAELKVEDIPRDSFRKIGTRLNSAIRRDPVVQTNRRAVWVDPIISCRLSFMDYGAAGELTEPKFEAIVVDQPGRFNSSRRESSESSSR